MPVYLDHNATTPLLPEVLEAMLPFFREEFGNASSRTHAWGWRAAAHIDTAREAVAALIGAEPDEIVFTSGATESINLALKGTFGVYRHQRPAIVVAATEHRAVLETCEQLQTAGAEILTVPVLSDGLIDLQLLKETVSERTWMVAVMATNNETGVVQPIRDIAAIAHEKGALFFSDITQAPGRLRIDVNEEGIDLCSLSAHKFHGPKGVGALFLRRKNPRVSLKAEITGGGQEHGRRSGTLNVPGIVGMGAAARIAHRDWWEDAQHISTLRVQLEQSLLDLGGITVNGSTRFRLPNTSNLCFHGINAGELMRKLPDIGVATGSACSSAEEKPSHVLTAMGLQEEASSSIRFSLGKTTTEVEILEAIDKVTAAVHALRNRA
ncbi:MAG: cysteine desulfurase family protein [Bacteroidota bacterium]